MTVISDWIPTGMLDLDHVGTEVGQDRGRQRPSDQGRRINDAYPLQWQ